MSHTNKKSTKKTKKTSETVETNMETSYPKTYEEAIKIKNKFWNTQPVMQINETKYGRIEEDKDTNSISQTPHDLNPNFYWDTLDISDDKISTELAGFLNKYYTNSTNSTESKFRPHYSSKFIQWILCSYNPNNAELYVGVRVKGNNLLVGFIGATLTMNHLKTETVQTTEVNFMCVHPMLRNKRLAVVLMKELTRRVNLKGCFQAVYMSDKYILNPQCTIQLYHRAIDIRYLVQLNFTTVKLGIKLDEIEKTLHLPNNPQNKNFSLLAKEDIESTCELLNKYLERYSYYPVFDTIYFTHLFFNNEFVKTYILKKPNGEIIDMISYYVLPLSNTNTDTNINTNTNTNTNTEGCINTGYLFYYTSMFETPYRLIKDILIVAKNDGLKLLSTYNIMENEDILHDLHFEPAGHKYHHYMYNWKCPNLKNDQIAKILI
ncbi:MAG: N-myristoyltransferase [Homavirus sp.]|uniref:glycylpeptide N-tetradecanoyltransferase n=1 Tax=Homavirus sp. TaxID=2487769 RepID=A0A3G5A4I9_9VIRU|nr:MAG: N-myristoyltransferase [Homavirus sp.]